MNEKINLINKLVENGYQMVNRTIESMCEFTVEDLQWFLEVLEKKKAQ